MPVQNPTDPAVITKKLRVIEALMDSRTRTAAAKAAGISRQQLYDLLAQPDFRELYESSVAQNTLHQRGRVSGAIPKAVDTAIAILDSDDEQIALRAARLLITIAFGDQMTIRHDVSDVRDYLGNLLAARDEVIAARKEAKRDNGGKRSPRRSRA